MAVYRIAATVDIAGRDAHQRRDNALHVAGMIAHGLPEEHEATYVGASSVGGSIMALTIRFAAATDEDAIAAAQQALAGAGASRGGLVRWFTVNSLSAGRGRTRRMLDLGDES